VKVLPFLIFYSPLISVVKGRLIFVLVVAVASGGEVGFVIATTIIIIMPIITGTLFVRFEEQGFIIIYHLLIFP
jgi:hypothetical protein